VNIFPQKVIVQNYILNEIFAEITNEGTIGVIMRYFRGKNRNNKKLE